MVGFDYGRRAFEGDAFDYVRIKRALGQEIDLSYLGGLLFKGLNKGIPDYFAFFLRIADSL